MRTDDALSIVIGFSHRACLPWAMQARTCSSWTKPGEATMTPSMPSSAMRSSGSPTVLTPSKRSARAWARSVSGSLTATSVELASR
jgi:hypothetical protein